MASSTHSRPVAEVFVNGRLLGQRITGVQRYAHETLRCIDQLLAQPDHCFARWTLLVPRGTNVPPFKHIAVRPVGWLRGHLWEQVELPWHARSGLLWSLGFTGPVMKVHQVVTVHDAAVVRMPQVYSWYFRAWYRFLMKWVAARAPRVLTVSRFGADEATKCFGIPPERIGVATEGWQHLERVVADEGVLDRHALRGKPFALAVSSPTPNKNFAAIGEALSLIKPRPPICVVVGAADPLVFQSDSDVDSLLHVGYVSDGQLKALYQHATGLLFPSFYEGFGIPALEAMSCGCPVIASTAPALREVCGDAALYFDPRRPAELAVHIQALFSSTVLQAHMRDASLKRADMFSWHRSALLNLAELRKLIEA